MHECPFLVTLYNENKLVYKGNLKLGWHLGKIEWCTVKPIENSFYTGYIMDTFKLTNFFDTWFIAFQYITIDGVEKLYWGNV